MKLQYSFIAVSLALAGCGGGSGSDSAAPTYDVAGTIRSQGSLLDTPVCIDLNQNFACDSNEPSAKSDNTGQFTLTSTDKNILNSTILAEVDAGSSKTLRIAAPGQGLASGNSINAVTTLVASLVIDGETVAQADEMVKAQVTSAGVSLTGTVMSDPTVNELTNLEQNTTALLTEMKVEEMTQGVALVAKKLNYENKSLVSSLLSAAETTAFTQELSLVAAQTSGSNDTGAVLHFADGASDVADAQTDFPGQDAEYGFDNDDLQTTTGAGFKFVKLDDKGATLAADATEWSCTLDERTGLIWENKSADTNSVQFKDRTFVYESDSFKPYSEDLAAVGCVAAGDEICSTSQYAAYINQQSLCGVNEWRLPTYLELYDVLDFGETERDSDGELYGLNHAYFPNQGIGSPDLEAGSMWVQDFSYINYSTAGDDTAKYFAFIVTRGDYRGNISFDQIYTDKADEDSGASYQFPIRLVAVKGQ
ncbi:DUF1566 domain-containing protein [Vibrio sp. nBUS_14]|uniref:Lcl domain-containing protein n=1 Tax=Vibrio sp. nBUS_14 TaxID=3395321 RepID=UPI003EB7EFFF